MSSLFGTWSFGAMQAQSPDVGTDMSQGPFEIDKGPMPCQDGNNSMNIDEDTDMTINEQIRATQKGSASAPVQGHAALSDKGTSSPSQQGLATARRIDRQNMGGISGQECSHDQHVFVDAREEQSPLGSPGEGSSHGVFEHRGPATISTQQELARNPLQPGMAAQHHGFRKSHAHQNKPDMVHHDKPEKRGCQNLVFDPRPFKRHQSQPPEVMMKRREYDDYSPTHWGINRSGRIDGEDRYKKQRHPPREFQNDIQIPHHPQQQFSTGGHGGIIKSLQDRHHGRSRQHSVPPSSMRHYEQRLPGMHSDLEPQDGLQRKLLSPISFYPPRKAGEGLPHSNAQISSPSYNSPDEDMGTLLRRSRPVTDFKFQDARQYLYPNSSMAFNDRHPTGSSTQQPYHATPSQQREIIDLISPEGPYFAKPSYRPHKSSRLANTRPEEHFELPYEGGPRRHGSREYPETPQRGSMGRASDQRMGSNLSSSSSKTSRKIDPRVIEDRRQQHAADKIIAREYNANRMETDMELFGGRIGGHGMSAQVEKEAESKLAIQKKQEREAEKLKKQEQREKQAEEERLRKEAEGKAKQVEKEKRAAEKAQRILVKREAEKRVEAAMQAERRKQAADKLQAEKEKNIAEARAKDREREQTETFNKNMKELGMWAHTLKTSLTSISAGSIRGVKRDAESDSDDELFVSEKGPKKDGSRSRSKSVAPQNAMELLASRMFQPDRDDERQAARDKRIKERQDKRRKSRGVSNGPKEQPIGNVFAPQPPKARKTKSKSKGRREYNADDEDSDDDSDKPVPPKPTSGIKLLDEVAREQEEKRKKEQAAAKAAERKAKKREKEGKRQAQKARDAKEKELRKEWQEKGMIVGEIKLRSLLDAHVEEYMVCLNALPWNATLLTYTQKKREERLREKDRKSGTSTPAESSFTSSTGSNLAETTTQPPTEKEQSLQEAELDDPEQQARKAKRDQMAATLAKARQDSNLATSFSNSMNAAAGDQSDTESDVSEEDPIDEPPPPVAVPAPTSTDTPLAQDVAQPQVAQRDGSVENLSHTLGRSDDEVQETQAPQTPKPSKHTDVEHIYLYMATQTKVIKGVAQEAETLSEKLMNREEANSIARFYFDQTHKEAPKNAKIEYQLSDDLFRSSFTFDKENSIVIEVKSHATLTSALNGYSPSLIEPRLSRKVYFVYLHTTYRKKAENENDEPIIDNREKCVDGQIWTDLKMANNEACKLFLDYSYPKSQRADNMEQFNEVEKQALECRDEANQKGCTFEAEFEPSPSEMFWLAAKGCQSFKLEVKELLIKGPIN